MFSRTWCDSRTNWYVIFKVNERENPFGQIFRQIFLLIILMVKYWTTRVIKFLDLIAMAWFGWNECYGQTHKLLYLWCRINYYIYDAEKMLLWLQSLDFRYRYLYFFFLIARKIIRWECKKKKKLHFIFFPDFPKKLVRRICKII